MRVDTTPDIERELSDFLTFEVPGAQYMPAVRRGHWDGKTRLYAMRYHSTYVGLLPRILRWAKAKQYPCTVDPKLLSKGPDLDMLAYARHLGEHLPDIKVRPYQLDSIAHALKEKRCVLVSPTGSGKSLIMYLLANMLNTLPILIVVPTISLVHQLHDMFKEYGYREKMQTISEGSTKDIDGAKLVISTWQSIYKLKSDWLNQFHIIFGDEAHTFKAKSLAEMMEKATAVEYRIGLTGTLDGAPVHEWLLEGLFGPVYQITDTATLIADGTLAAVNVKQIILQHPKNALKRGFEYRDELNYLAENDARNRFIKRLALSMKQNTLILFTLVERHGIPLYNAISASTDKAAKVALIHGQTAVQEREKIRQLAKSEKNLIMVCSYGTFSTGIDITHIHNIIFASPSKSRIRVLQSIGRGVRKSVDKVSCTVYDIADALPGCGRKYNFTLTHAKIRSEYYAKEQFPMEQYVIPLSS